VSFPQRFVSNLNVELVLKSNLEDQRGSRWRNAVVPPSGEFHSSNFPRALSRFPVHDRARRAASLLRRSADDAPRSGLCALRSRISRYTYATRDLLPMIMRGWKYALQEEEEEMGPSPTAIERPLSIDVTATSSSMYSSYRCQTRCSTRLLKRG